MRSLLHRAERRVEQDEPDADERADADHLPLEAAADHALRERGDQRRLRRGQRIRRDARRRSRAPAKPYALASRLSTDGITAAPAATPTMSAICWRIGDAPTSWPVFRSCRLSFEIVAQANTIAVTNSANATSAGRVVRRRRHGERERRRADDDRQDADARDRAVRRADESRHVAADAGDEEADDRTRTAPRSSVSVTALRREHGRAARTCTRATPAISEARDRERDRSSGGERSRSRSSPVAAARDARACSRVRRPPASRACASV